MWQTISRYGVVFSLASIGACAGTVPVPNEPVPATAPSPVAADTRAPAAKGMRVYKDPVTGEFKEPPPEAAQQFQTPAPKTTVESRESPVVKPSSVAGGGVEVDVRGRFRSYSKAIKDVDGKISIHCDPIAPEAPLSSSSPAR